MNGEPTDTVIKGSRYNVYLKPEDRLKFVEIIEREGSVIELDVEFKKKDGVPIPALLTGHVRFDQKGNVIGYEGIIVDQTQRKQMEREIRETNDFLNNSAGVALRMPHISHPMPCQLN